MVVFGDGSQTRDFTYVEDTARGILLAGLSPDTLGETINLGSGREVTVTHLAAQVGQAVGRQDAPVVHAPPRPGDVLRLCADSTKARNLLGFTAQVSLDEGLKRLKDWVLSLPQTPEQLLQQEAVQNWRAAA
jgi:UDP-glucose 4-epimerase